MSDKSMAVAVAALVVVLAAGPGVAMAGADSGQRVAAGFALWQAGDLDGAENAFREAVSADPTAAEPRMKLAGLLISRQRYREGIEQFQEVVGHSPGNANAFVGMAIGYLHLGQTPLAAAALEEALRADPASAARVEPLLARVRERLAAVAAHHQGLGPEGVAP